MSRLSIWYRTVISALLEHSVKRLLLRLLAVKVLPSFSGGDKPRPYEITFGLRTPSPRHPVLPTARQSRAQSRGCLLLAARCLLAKRLALGAVPRSQQVVYSLNWIECLLRYLNEHCVPVGHASIPQTRQF